ncbi:Uncharacterized protein Rs2_42328 [Raphanus sativus]|uniref:Uncharacterized protein LOC108828485 n=1 Tax=Raphanus sativus TaxID=3726 RepID=A0A6J0LC90_RAPSA|nr:uncharacterized protein LOC108828485 [Raphanus sativus]XP_056850522.1 uncharacterized protein LOC108828485 [Raphanus sativus]XP_056850523.1 uncharacterized protein LOC108828485 [Raphanus sativus]KAJ4877310.1 Uncharacterized protein Rs2_42328 [Raphanus sativus]
MLRQLPPTITADETPEWLPVGWIVHSTALKRGRQTKTYTHLRTGRKLATKDQVIEFIRMDEIREHRESAILRKKALLKALQDEEEAVRERASRLQNDLGSISYCRNPYYEMYDNNNISSGLNPHSEQEVPQCQTTNESEAASFDNKLEETGSEYITYDYNTEEEDWSENEGKGSQENVETFSNVTSTPLRLQPERMTKLDSRAINQCLLEDEENIQEVETSKAKEDGLKESFGEENLQVVDKAREIPGLSGSFTIEINLNCEPPLGDSLVEKDWNQIGNQESDLSQEPGNKSEETLNTQATTQEETATELRGPDDVINTIKLGLNPSPVTPQEKNISGSKKRKKSAEPCSSKKKDKRTPRKPQGGKGSSSEKTPVEWPEPCPNFPFEPLTISQDDDSVIRRYLEQYYTAAGSADGNVHLPDFGLPSFSNIIKVSQNEEPESKKSLDPPCVASSSLPRCVSMVVTMQQTVAGN